MNRKIYSKIFSQGQFETYSDKPSLPVIHCHQVHSTEILEYEGKDISNIKADGIILDPVKYPETILGIKTADCLPVLYIGEKIALVHAGWKGLSEGILTHRLLQSIMPTTILIGPSIHKYEVTEEFRSHFSQSDSFYKKDEQLFFNLQQHATQELTKVFKNCEILDSAMCTLTNMEYNSYRRNKTNQRNWNIFKFNRG